MTEITTLGRRCGKIVDTLGSHIGGEVELLRTARVLKSLHRELRRAVWHHARDEGRTRGAACAGVALDVIERDLRLALLEYSSLQRIELHAYLVNAATESLKVIESLERDEALCSSVS